MRIFTVCQKVKVCRRRTHRFPPRGAPHGLQQSLLQRMEHVGASRFSTVLRRHAARGSPVRPSTHLNVNNGIPQNEACWQRERSRRSGPRHGSGAGVVPWFAPSTAMMQEIIRRAHRLTGGRGRVEVPHFPLASRGQGVGTMVITFVVPDSVEVSYGPGSRPARHPVDAQGRLLSMRTAEGRRLTVRTPRVPSHRLVHAAQPAITADEGPCLRSALQQAGPAVCLAPSASGPSPLNLERWAAEQLGVRSLPAWKGCQQMSKMIWPSPLCQD
jgi:hypothetical protein